MPGFLKDVHASILVVKKNHNGISDRERIFKSNPRQRVGAILRQTLLETEKFSHHRPPELIFRRRSLYNTFPSSGQSFYSGIFHCLPNDIND